MSARPPFRRLGDTTLLWRQLSTRAGASIGVALLVLGAATIGMAAPRAVERLNTASVQQRVSELTAPERDLVADAAGGPEIGPVPSASSAAELGLSEEVAAVWGKQEAALRGIRDDLSPLLQRSLGAPEYTVQFGALRAQKPGAGPAAPVHLVLPTFDPRLAERVRYIDGAAPRSDATPLPRAEAVEIALSEQTAAEMEWPIGEERWTELDGAGAQLLRLAGIFVAADADDPYWQHTLAALASSIVDDGISPPQFTSVAFVDPTSWAAFGVMPVMPRSHIWYPLQLQTLRSTENAALLVDLREVSTQPVVVDSGHSYDRFAPLDPPGTVPSIPSIGAVELGSSAIATLERSERADAALVTVLALTAIGPFGVSVAVIVLGTGIVANRRRRSIGLAAARGASERQLRVVLGIEGALIAMPAAVLGAVLGTLLVPGVDPSTVGFACTVLLAATPLTVLVARASEFGAGGLRAPGAGRAISGSSHRARPRLRWMLELATIGLAVAGTVSVLGRGYDEDSSGVDPLVAATPLLLSLAVCIAALRLYPLPLAAIERAAGRRRGLVSVLGARRALREPATGFAPVLALVVGVSVAVFSGVMLGTVSSGVEQTAAARVGADMRLSAAPITADQLEQLRAVPGIEATAPVYSARSVLISAESSRVPAVLLVVDSKELAAVQAGVPGAPTLPAALGAAVDDQGARPTPVVVSRGASDFLDDAIEFQIGTYPAERVGISPDPSPLTTSSRWLLIDKANAAALTPTLLPRMVLIDLTAGADPRAVQERLVALLGDDIEVTLPAGLSAEIRQNPSIAGLQTALAIAITIAALLSAAAVVMTLVLGAPARERLLGVLRVLGLPRGQARALLLWEIGPVAVVALTLGSLLGLWLPQLVLAGVDLTPFTGGSVQPTASIDPLFIVASIGGFLAVVLLAAASSLALARRASLARAIRLEEE